MSAILSVDDLNDFISPGLACIKPVETLPAPKASGDELEVEIEIDSLGNASEVGSDGKTTTLSAAQISLADCLACSGCVTSAEEVLVAQHSHDQLLKAITTQTSKVFVASISHQTRSSLAIAFNKTVEQVDRLVIDLLKNQMGFQYVVGTGLGRKLSLINEAHNAINTKQNGANGPILSSICPGWVLYAEKTHPFILPRISTVKSAQQITGCLLKSIVGQTEQTMKLQVYHLSLMPCFDKKLESARKERNDTEDDVAEDVDCVLTAKELVTLVEQLEGKYSFRWDDEMTADSASVYKSSAPDSWPFIELTWSNDSGSSSGGYAVHYLDSLKVHYLNLHRGLSDGDVVMQTILGRNADITEMRLVNKSTSETIGSAAIVNGFRNIQNLVRKLKPGKTATKKVNPLVARRRARKEGTPSSIESVDSNASVQSGSADVADASRCDYVEIMACPGGCINGGGQISAPKDVPEKEWLLKASQAYGDIPIMDVTAEDVAAVLEEWVYEFCQQFNIKQERLLRTWFQEVEKPTDPNTILLGAKW